MNDLGEKIKNPELSNIWIKIGLSAKNCFLYYCKLKNDFILSGNEFFNLVNSKKLEEDEYSIFLNCRFSAGDMDAIMIQRIFSILISKNWTN